MMSTRTINKYGDIMIGVQARDRLSLGEHRERLGFGAFHWSVMIRTKSWHHRFDVTDGIVQDPDTLEIVNPDGHWVYRHLKTKEAVKIPRYLGAVVIGRLKSSDDVESIEALLKTITPPEKDKRPQRNCVSWTVDAAQALQRSGYCLQFDIDPCKEFVLHHADDRIKNFVSGPDVIQYPAAIVADEGFWRSLMSRVRKTS